MILSPLPHFHLYYRDIILSDKYCCPLPVSLLTVLYVVDTATAHTGVGIVTGRGRFISLIE